ncbi:MAG: AAA family ATPase [Planctomycetota bacterium]|nr:AAA family ATPase [Planctomycetota bacterium]
MTRVAVRRIHITGASGTGTSTLGRDLAQALELPHHDADTFFWEPTEPPFQQKRELAARDHLVADALSPDGAWILSGSIVRWAVPELAWFDLVVFLTVPAEVRLARLRARELERFGPERLGPGGDMHTTHLEFMAWAERYDTAGVEQRSLAVHEAWLGEVPCPVLRVDGDISRRDRVTRVQAHLDGSHRS